MDTVVSAITAWKNVIGTVVEKYTLAAALISLVAVGAYFYLEKELRPKQAPTNILIVLFGWSIAVPVLGGILWVLGQIWDMLKEIVPWLASALSSLFAIYKEHPFLVLALCLAAAFAYVGWKRWRPNVLPNRLLRIIVLGIAVTLFAHLASPFADILSPKQKPTTVEEEAPKAPAANSAPVSQDNVTSALTGSASPSPTSPSSPTLEKPGGTPPTPDSAMNKSKAK